jgi:hypothetical protein
MARPALKALALMTLAQAVTACDRLPRHWPFGAAPNSVTVKLPPARRAPAPGFTFEGGEHSANAALRLGAREA